MVKKEFKYYWEKDSDADFEPQENEVQSISFNMSETEGEIVLKADVKGYTKKDIDVNVSEDSVEIKAKKKIEEKTSQNGIMRKEISTGSMRRYFTLPVKIKPEKVKAVIKNGTLVIFMEKKLIGKK